MSEQEFDNQVIQVAEQFDATLPENQYPIFGGALNGKPNSNTFVDNVIENAGGKIKNFDKALNQNAGSKYIRGLLTIYGFFFFVFSGVFLSSLFPKNNLAIVCSLLFTLVLIPVIEVWGNIFWWLIGVLITVTSISGIYIVSKLKYWPQKN